MEIGMKQIIFCFVVLMLSLCVLSGCMAENTITDGPDAEYEITFIQENGITNVKALTIKDNGFSLTNNEGGGGYERVDGDVFEQFFDGNG